MSFLVGYIYVISRTEPGASGSECSETYYGPSAASESETQTTVDFVNSITQPPWIMDISVHTYGYYMLAPYGNGTYPPNWLPDDNGFEGFVSTIATSFRMLFDIRMFNYLLN